MSQLTGRCTALLDGITGRVGQVLSRAEEIGVAAESIAGTARATGRELRRADFAVLRPLVAGLLREQAGLVAGAGVVLAPDVAADAPRAIEWWWADAGSRISQLHVDTDPGSAECYDYTTTEWYREPERTGRAAVAGPYVDFICTREYTFTLAVPVHGGGRFLGVAGADILAGQVERLALPGLVHLGRAAVLATGPGRVIASNTASFPPGSVLGRPLPAGLVPVAGPAGRDRSPGLLPWTLLSTC
ncbi:MAG TPA: cache domain-containing protein [Streptosporangiaceae bacterium]|nr:cache domain-containing protein [Streptosporangiaceae bacterium]